MNVRLLILLLGLFLAGKSFASSPCPTSGLKDNCFGSYTYPNGDKYTGEFRHDKRHGYGTYTWANGAKYAGEWRDDRRNGLGTYTSADGEKSVGEWRDSAFYPASNEVFVSDDPVIGLTDIDGGLTEFMTEEWKNYVYWPTETNSDIHALQDATGLICEYTGNRSGSNPKKELDVKPSRKENMTISISSREDGSWGYVLINDEGAYRYGRRGNVAVFRTQEPISREQFFINIHELHSLTGALTVTRYFTGSRAYCERLLADDPKEQCTFPVVELFYQCSKAKPLF